MPASSRQAIPNSMFRNLNKAKTFIFFSLLYLNGYCQDKIPKDTTSRIILCQSSVSYPQEAHDNNISGTVIVLFDLDSNCRFVNIRIEKGIGYGCDEEAIKALKKCKPIFLGRKKTCTPIFNLRQPFTFVSEEDD